MAKNYYIILGIKSEASDQEIKEAYRKKVQKYHPDHYGSDSSQFISIQEAYEVLGNPARRKKYDNSLLNVKKHQSKNVKRTTSKYSSSIEPLIQKKPVEEISIQNSFNNFSPSFEELFDRYWSNFSNVSQSKSERAENINVEIKINQHEAKYGGQITLRIPVRINCPVCFGSGAFGFGESPQCDCYGIVEEELPLIITYPGGIKNQFSRIITLDRYGINNFYLTINFKVRSRNK